MLLADDAIQVSVILKHADNMLHVFAHQSTTVAVTVASTFLFHMQPTLMFVCAAAIVFSSIYIFNAAKHLAPIAV